MALSNQAFCRVRGEILNLNNREVSEVTIDREKASVILGFDVSELGVTRTAMILEGKDGLVTVTSHAIKPESNSKCLFEPIFNRDERVATTALSDLRDAGLNTGYYTTPAHLEKMDARLNRKKINPALAA